MTTISPLRQEITQKPSLEIVNMGEQKSEDKACTVSGASRKHLIGGMRSVDQPERKESHRASTGKTVWKKVVKGFKIRFPTSASVSKPSMATMGKSVEVPENLRRKDGSWVRSFANLFQRHSKKQSYHVSSEMSTFQRNYLLIKDGMTPASSNSPLSIPPFAFNKRISKAAQTISQQYQRTLKLGKLRKSVTDILRKSRDSDQKQLFKTFMEAGSGHGNEKSDIPLLEYTTEESSSANTSSGLSGYDPLTSHKLPPPWILRKWKLRDSQRLLRIDPVKELLFHLTDGADKHYTCTIKLENSTSRYVAFKFKSTCPEGYLMRPKHGILAPNARLEVKGLKIGDPLFPSMRDLFVVVTLPIPAGVMKQTTEIVSASIFDRFQAQCYCEGVLHAVFSRNIADSEGQGKVNAVLDRNVSLTSIPEECDREHQQTIHKASV